MSDVFDALKCIVQSEKLIVFLIKYHYWWLRSFIRSISTLLQCITQWILDHRNHIQTQMLQGYRLDWKKQDYSESRWRRCNHCFVGIFYDDVFARIVCMVDFFHKSFQYLDLLYQRLRPRGTHLELLQRLFVAHVNDSCHVCTHVQYLNWIIQTLSDIICNHAFFFHW